MPDVIDPCETLEREGFAVVEQAVEAERLDEVIRALEALDAGAQRYGMRNLFEELPVTRGLVTHHRIASLVETVLGPEAFAVRGILFDKLEGRNWHVGWHQDQAIAIRERVDAPGFGPTSVKDGVPHTRGSTDVLEQMLAVRIHLDHCGPDNGPLRCVPGSHKLGRLGPDEFLCEKERLGETTCTVGRGGVLLMRPLCLHASSPATSPRHRRVIHLEFAGCGLPEPLDWHERHPIRG